MSEDLRQVRLDKLHRLRELGVPVYPDRFERTHTLGEAAQLAPGTGGLRLAGRVIAARTFGKLTFAHLSDLGDKLQIALEKSSLDEATWSLFHDLVDRGDFVGVDGELFTTKKGELTLRVQSLTFLGKSLMPLPEKWHGIKDADLRQRRRYLDLIMSPETRDRFRQRTATMRALRRFLDTEGFDEVETPTLQTVASGATARPFHTHHNALDIPLSLRIAPETWLKRLVVGGYDKVYEFARCFRNEGMDPSHLQEFTLLEYYCAYWNWEDNMKFTERLIRQVIEEVLGEPRITWRGREIDFSGEWPRIDMRDLVLEHAGIDIEAHPDVASLRAAVRDKGLAIEKLDQLGRGNLVDAIYKQTAREQLIQPCFLTGIPADTLPLARANDTAPHKADCFQLLVNGWEIVKAYSELVDPILQRERFVEQEQLRQGGDDEAMLLDEDYLLAMEHGMPPISGWGLGIERFCALISGVDSLREVTLFPLLRPEFDVPQPAPSAAETTSAPAERPAETEAASAPSGPDLSADVGDFGLTRDQSLALFDENVTTEGLRAHCFASAAVLEAIADRFGKNRDTYWCMGLLHDLDFDRVKEMDKHTLETVAILRERGVSDETIIHAILSHNEEGLGIARETWLDYALSCGETITGLVMATAKVMPDKKIASVKASSVKKRMKKKEFARQVNRDAIRQCEKIGIELGDFCALALDAMQKIAPQLGL